MPGPKPLKKTLREKAREAEGQMPAVESHFDFAGPVFGSGDEEPVEWVLRNGVLWPIPKRAWDD